MARAHMHHWYGMRHTHVLKIDTAVDARARLVAARSSSDAVAALLDVSSPLRWWFKRTDATVLPMVLPALASSGT